jgi:hypothetical protein
VPLTIEHRVTGEYFGPQTPRSTQNSQLDTAFSPLCRRTIIRWCDWLDAEIHLRTHRRWHESPSCFDPDPETRHLAALGNAQRHLAKLDDRAKACWLADFATAAEHYQNSPKWSALGKAMADDSDRQWQHPDVDTLVISLWPLVKAYNWTYRDLLNVIRPALKRGDAYPCASEQDFAAYCANVLGMRKAGKGVSAKNGRPKGSDVAKEWCPAMNRL